MLNDTAALPVNNSCPGTRHFHGDSFYKTISPDDLTAAKGRQNHSCDIFTQVKYEIPMWIQLEKRLTLMNHRNLSGQFTIALYVQTL